MEVSRVLNTFPAMREWNVALVRTAGPEVLTRPTTHPERGDMTFGTLV